MNCKEFEELLTLEVYGELPPDRRVAFEEHLAGCDHCRALRGQVSGLHRILALRPPHEPSPDFLVECRQELAGALERERLGWHALIRDWLAFFDLPPQRLAPRVTFALSLMVFSFGLGWLLRARATRVVGPSSEGVTASSLAEPDFENMRINDISRVAPDPKTGDVHITMDAQRRVTLEGSLDDPRIQQLLVNAMKSYDNAGIRRDTLDALRARSKSPNVRAALLYTMQHDTNVGNRLAALDAVRGMESGNDLQQSLLAVLEHDKNMGVRVESVDLLVDRLEKEGRDGAILRALVRLAKGDPNRYVRLKCGSALRKLGDDGFLQPDGE